jgi:serine/threonine protein kinase
VSLTPGTRLGPYEVTAQIGVGGMGEVYRATDTNLKRAVAIKVLPDALASEVERLTRFQREAEILAALNHPNIAQIHGLEHADGVSALVMELVEGPTLADRGARGPIPRDDTDGRDSGHGGIHGARRPELVRGVEAANAGAVRRAALLTSHRDADR